MGARRTDRTLAAADLHDLDRTRLSRDERLQRRARFLDAHLADAVLLDRVQRGTYTRGTDLVLDWAVDHDASALQIVDLGGGNGAARCTLTHGDGTVMQTASDVQNVLLGSAPSLFVGLFASTFEETTVESTVVRQSRTYSAASTLLDVVDP